MQPESFARWEPAAHRQPADFTVRLGTEADVPACTRLVVALGAGEEAAWRETLLRTARDGVRRALFLAVVASDVHDSQVAGFGRVVYAGADPDRPDAAPPGWYLLGLAVDPAWRRRGIGQALTRARMAWVAERAERLYCFTGSGNRVSQELHERLGFVPLPGQWVPPGGRPGDAGKQQFYRVEFGGLQARGRRGLPFAVV